MPMLNELTMFFLISNIFSVFGDKDSLNVGNVIFDLQIEKSQKLEHIVLPLGDALPPHFKFFALPLSLLLVKAF
jgi:hypothetical protein